MTVSVDGLADQRRRASATTTPIDDPAERRPDEVERHPADADVSRPPARAMAVRSTTSAVASLTSDSPSRMVTTRRGRPIRRAIAVAATASGGATTAPRANAAANGTGSSHQVTSADAERREDHQPDREASRWAGGWP